MSKFSTLLSLIKDGMTFILNEGNSIGHFLLFSDYYPTQTITLHTNCVPYWVEFDGDEPMRLEDCPDCFFDTLILNIKMGNYTMRGE